MSDNESASAEDAPPKQATQFEQLGQEKSESLVGEFILFLTENKKWWMIPILLVLGLMGVLVVAASTGAAPFIYTLF